MRMKKRLAVFVVALLAASPAWAYVYTQCGNYLCHWDGFPVGYLVSDSIANLFPGATEVATTAMRRWNKDRQTFCEIELNFGGTTAKAASEADEDNIVFALTHDWPYGKETLAVTQCFFDAQGEMRDCDIMVNAQDWEWDDHFSGDTVLNLSDTITHEAGHFWGLGHSEEKAATMYAYYDERLVASDLDEDDIRGAADAYCSDDMPPDDEREQNDSLYTTRDPFEEITLPGLRLYDIDAFRIEVREGEFPLIEIKDDEPSRHKLVRVYDNVRDLLGESRCDGDCLVAPTQKPPASPIVYLEIQTDFERSKISADRYDLVVTQTDHVDPSALTDDDEEPAGDDEEEEDEGGCGFFGPVSGSPGGGGGLGVAVLLLAFAALALRRIRVRD